MGLLNNCWWPKSRAFCLNEFICVILQGQPVIVIMSFVSVEIHFVFYLTTLRHLNRYLAHDERRSDNAQRSEIQKKRVWSIPMQYSSVSVEKLIKTTKSLIQDCQSPVESGNGIRSVSLRTNAQAQWWRLPAYEQKCPWRSTGSGAKQFMRVSTLRWPQKLKEER